MVAEDELALADYVDGIPAEPVEKPRVVEPARRMILVWVALGIISTIWDHHILARTTFNYPAALSFLQYLMIALCVPLRRFISVPPETLIPTKEDLPTYLFLAVGGASFSIAVKTSFARDASISLVQMALMIIPTSLIFIMQLYGRRPRDISITVVSVAATLGAVTTVAAEKQFSWPVACSIITAISFGMANEGLADRFSGRNLCVAPVGAALALSYGLVVEGFAPLSHLWMPSLLGNTLVAVGLNIVGSALPGLQAAGSVKTVILVLFSWGVQHSTMTPWQWAGLAISASGLCLVYFMDSHDTSRLLGQIDGKKRASINRLVILAFTVVGLGTVALYPHYSPHHFTPGQLSWYRHFSMAPQAAPGDGNFGKFSLGGKGLDIIGPFNPETDIASLPRAAWVVVATSEAIAKYRDELMAMSCWASRQGIAFYIEAHLIVSDRHFFTARHANVAKHLRNYQWVIASDADFIPVDSKLRIEDWLDDSVDLILQDRPPNEICACFYMVKNSPGGWSFLQRWMAWADHGARCNYDNGDLVEMIGAGLVPGPPNSADYTGRYMNDAEWPDLQPALRCFNNIPIGHWGAYKDEFLQCSLSQITQLRSWTDDDLTTRYGVADLWSFTDVLPSTRLKLWRLWCGPLRYMEGSLSNDTWWGAAIPGDVIVSGKSLGNYMPEAAIFCDGRDWVSTSLYDLETARKQMKTEAKWWPGCWDQDGSYHCD